MQDKKLSRRSFLKASALTAAAFALDWGKMGAYAATIEKKSDYPVVVIGAGLGGLCCGAYLSRYGFPVTVVEQHSIPGGYATSFDRGRFTFEVSLKATCLQNNSTARILKDLGVLEKLRLVELPEVTRIKGAGFEIPLFSRDPEGLITRLSERFPGEKKGIRAAIEEMMVIAGESQKVAAEKGKAPVRDFSKRYPGMWNVRGKTLADFLTGYVADPALQDILAVQWGSSGLPPSRLSAFYYAVALGETLRNGSYYVRPRAQALSNALAGAIESSGGKLLYNTLAEKIVLEDGKVSGVTLPGGKVVPARVVVNNGSAPTMFSNMLPAGVLPPEYSKRIDGYRPSMSMFIVWLGLNRELREKFRGYRYGVSSGQGPEADYRYGVEGVAEKGSFGVTFYDSLFEGYSAPGTSTLHISFLCGYEPWRRFENDYRAGRKQAYEKEKERWTDILVRRAEKELIPGLSSMIEVKESATPLTCWSFTRNVEGSIYGFEQSLNNAYMNRIDNRTPVKGLYLSSAWGSPGGGYTGALKSGQIAFGKILEDLAM
jgi:prolycopene isomerase